MTRLPVSNEWNGLQMCGMAANVWNIQSTAEKRCSSSLGFRLGLTTPCRKSEHLKTFTGASDKLTRTRIYRKILMALELEWYRISNTENNVQGIRMVELVI
jgi:hypothetical protein